MILSNTDFTVIYVDPGIASAGDGSSPGSALSALPEDASALTDKACYLVRRTACGEVLLPTGENTSVTALAVLGMPKASDELYALMPEAAKSAWGADAADYANIKADTGSDPYGDSGSLKLTSCTHFVLSRVFLYREGQDAYQPMVSIPDESYAAAVSVTHCRFGLRDADLADASCTSSPAYSAGLYISCGKMKAFTLRDCRIDAVTSGYGMTENYGIQLADAHFTTVSGIEAWCATFQSMMGGAGPLLRLSTSSTNSSTTAGGTANIVDVSFHILVNGSYGEMPPLLYSYGSGFLSFKGVSAELVARHLGSSTPDTLSISSSMIQLLALREYDIKGVTVNLPSVWSNPNSNAHVLHVTATGGAEMPGACHILENVTVTLAESGGIDASYSGNYYTSQIRKSDSWYSCCAVRLDLESYSDMYSVAHEPCIVKGINVTHPRGVALYVAGCWLKNCSLKGAFRCSRATCDIASMETWYPGYAILAGSQSTVKVGTLTLGKGNISGYDSDPAVGNDIAAASSYVFVGTSNGALLGDTRSTETSYDNRYAAVCANEQDTGHYTMKTANCVCDTWGVARSGSAYAASLKLSNQAADGPGYMSFGRQPFGGFKVAATAGSRTLKLRVAAKGLGDLADLAEHLVVQASVPQTDGTQRTYVSSTDGRWSEDAASAWIGESSLSPRILEMPFAVPADGDVDVRIHYRWFSASGYMYIDPDIVIE